MSPRCPEVRCRRRASSGRAPGFAFITAIFLLVMLGAMAGFVVSIAADASAAGALAIQRARALEAARTGLGWAIYRLRDPNATYVPGATALPDCFSSPRSLTAPGALASFAVVVTCTRYPSSTASPNYHEEDARRSAFFVVTSTASFGIAGGAEYVEQKLQAEIETCKDAAAPAPSYACN